MSKANYFVEQAQKKEEREKLWALTMQNMQKVGNKTYVFIPLDLLFVDEAFQRCGKSVKDKINYLTRHWDWKKFEALKVSLHEEDHSVSVIDGGHRFGAAKNLGLYGLVCEVLEDMPHDPEERLKEEARIFATQGDEVDKLAPVDAHKANVIRGIYEYVALEELLQKYDIPLKRTTGGGRVGAGILAGYVESVRIIKRNGKEMLDNIFYILCSARWNMVPSGLSSDLLRSIEIVLNLHPDHTKEIIEETIKFFLPIPPRKFFSMGVVTYPERSMKEGYVLVLEDYLCDKIGMERLYMKDRVKERHSGKEIAA